MKFYGVLRDSYREAMSTWVIPLMLVFTFLLVLLIGSVGFRPISAEEELQNKLAFSNFQVKYSPAFRGKDAFTIENFKTSNQAEPWNADYEFAIVFRGSQQGWEMVEGNPTLPVTRRRAEIFVKNNMTFLNNVKAVDQSPETNPNDDDKKEDNKATIEKRFLITTQGTKIKDRSSWFHQPSLFFSLDYFQTYTLRDGVYTLEKRLVSDVGAWVLILVSIVATAGFIPNLLRKGSIDLYISKPIGRVELLIYKYIGGLTLVVILFSAMVGAVWVTVGLRTGFWNFNFLLIIPLLTFYFAILYAFSTLAAVLTRSSLVAILLTVTIWGSLILIGFVHDNIYAPVKEAERRLSEQIAKSNDTINPFEDDEIKRELEEANRAAGSNDGSPFKMPRWADILNYVLTYPTPRTSEIDNLMKQVIAEGILTDFELKERGLNKPLPSLLGTFGVSLLHILVCLGLSSVVVARRDF